MNQNQNKINVEKLFTGMMSSINILIDKLDKIDPASEEYGVALSNLAKAFNILSGATVKGDK